MLLNDEILKKEQILIPNSGLRERFFYSYLTQKNIYNSDEIPSDELEKVCYAAFMNSELDVSSEIKKSLQNQPIKGLHFSTNLISLIAFSLKSNEAKEVYLPTYYKEHSFTDQFIISRIFNDYDIINSSNPKDIFDNLIEVMFVNKDILQAQKLILKAFEQVTDLKELFIVRVVYHEILYTHPNTRLESEYIELSSLVEKIVKHEEKWVNIIFNFFALIISVIILIYTPYFIVKNWTDLALEPYTVAIPITGGIFGFLLIILFNVKPDWFKLTLRIKQILLRKAFREKGIEINKLKQLLKNDKSSETL